VLANTPEEEKRLHDYWKDLPIGCEGVDGVITLKGFRQPSKKFNKKRKNKSRQQMRQ